jgi:hypothetical protein
MIAIHTKYLGPTNTKGARIKVSAYCGATKTMSVPYDHSSHDPHEDAAYEFCKRLNLWGNVSYAGLTPDGKGQVYSVFCIYTEE